MNLNILQASQSYLLILILKSSTYFIVFLSILVVCLDEGGKGVAFQEKLDIDYHKETNNDININEANVLRNLTSPIITKSASPAVTSTSNSVFKDYEYNFYQYYIDNSTNSSEMLYIELQTNDYHKDLLNNPTYSNLLKKTSYYTIDTFWFTKQTLDSFKNGLFYAVGVAKMLDSTTMTHEVDFVICKWYFQFKKCDDYFYKGQKGKSLNESIILDFNAVNDYGLGGYDSILWANPKDPVKDYIGSFTLGFDYTVKKNIYALDSSDIDFNTNNQIVFVYGHLDIDNNKSFFDNPKFLPLSIKMANISDIYKNGLSGSSVKTATQKNLIILHMTIYIALLSLF